jgi:hypothetical protein
LAEQADPDAGLGEAGSSYAEVTLNESTDADTADTALAAWSAVLDMLEMAVHAAERTLKDPLGPLSVATGSVAEPRPEKRWSPPSLSGPLPAAARRRAVALAAAQERVAIRLEEARIGVARQLQAVSSVPGVGESSGAVYLDVNG